MQQAERTPLDPDASSRHRGKPSLPTGWGAYCDPGNVEESASRILEFCCQAVRKHTIVCDGVVREGNPAQQVLEASHDFPADRIILGTRSRNKLSKLLSGSVAEQVLRSANIPVLTVGPEARLPVDASPTERVVLTPPH